MDAPVLTGLLKRYAEAARDLVVALLLPAYAPYLVVGNTQSLSGSVEAEGRVQSKRHDDRLLHVDSFPSR